MAEINEFLNKIFNGNVRCAARLMRFVDDRVDGYEEYMKKVWPKTGRAHIIGITGAPGAGKSTITDCLIGKFRGAGKTVGVVAIDPTSPFSGGAILGDRIRMSGHATDEGVFIRSVGTRGHLGGLSVSTMDIVAVMDAMGKDVIIIETVGVGQDEVEIAMVADTCIVVTVPGLGDDIQAIKAGIFEIADIFIVNKADREGAERTARDLEMMLDMTSRKDGWNVEILKTVAAKGEGIEEVIKIIDSHEAFFDKNVKNEKLRQRILHVSYGALREKLVRHVFTEEKLLALIDKGLDPYTCVEKLWEFGRECAK